MIRNSNGWDRTKFLPYSRAFAASAASAVLAFTSCGQPSVDQTMGNGELQRVVNGVPSTTAIRLRSALGLPTKTAPAALLPEALAINPIGAAVRISERRNNSGTNDSSPDAPASSRPQRPEIVQLTLNDNNTIVSFNCKLGHAEWVAWTVSANDLGSTKRSKDFHPEPQLPEADCISPQPNDIGVSGFDRGHMAPSGDRTSSRQANDAVFSMANIVPQAPQVNQKGWNDLEILTRDRVRSGQKSAIVYSGTSGTLGKIRGSGINIPAVTWKIVFVIPADADFVNESNIETIAVWYPNDLNAAPLPLPKALVSIDEIESRTQLDFLSGLPNDLQNRIEQKQTSLPR